MPTPERTSQAQIVAAALDLLERRGLAHLTMQAVAEQVGVRAPSLYKRVRNRDDLIRLVTEAAFVELGQHLRGVDGQGLAELAHAVRAFARERPET